MTISLLSRLFLNNGHGHGHGQYGLFMDEHGQEWTKNGQEWTSCEKYFAIRP